MNDDVQQRTVGRPRHRAARVPDALVAVVDSGDRRAALEALRHRLAEAVSDAETHPRDLAALARQLSSTMSEIETIDRETPTGPSAVDLLVARREARRTGGGAGGR